MRRTAEELRELLEHGGTSTLRLYLEESHPGHVAESLAELEPHEIIRALRHVRKDKAIEIFEFFPEETQAAIFEGMARREMAEFLEEMAPDDRADLIKRLKPDLVDSVLSLMAQVDREDIRKLSSYREGTAGAIMTTDYACLPTDITVAEALEQLRLQAPDRETIYYVYVVDSERRLVGFVELKDLIVARPAAHKKVRDVMERDVIRVKIGDDPIEVARTIAKYDLIAVPVVDSANRLVGIVTVDDALDLLDPGGDRDARTRSERAAASVLGYVDRSAWATNRSRGLWLLVPALIAVIAWLQWGRGETTLALLLLAVGLPVMVALGVSPGARCSASTSRDLVRERPPLPSFVRNLLDEMAFGAPPALAVVVVSGLLLALRPGPALRSESNLLITVTWAALVQVLGAALVGGTMSLVVRAFRLPVERFVSPTALCAPDALGLILYFCLVAPAAVSLAG